VSSASLRVQKKEVDRVKRRVAGLLVLLLLLQLSLAGFTTVARAESDTELLWEIEWTIDYPGRPGSPAPNDQLAQFLGFERSLLVDGGQLQLRMAQKNLAQQDNRYLVEAIIIAGENQLILEGEGEYGSYLATPLLHGEFAAKSSRGDDCRVFVAHYPTDSQVKVTLQFGADTPAESLLTFGEGYGNIQAIHSQLDARAKQRVKLPSAFWLDGQQLVFQPAALLQDDQVLVPVRQLLQALGANVDWDAASQCVVVNRGDMELRLAVGGQQLLVGQQSVPLGAAVLSQSGVTFAPYAPLAKALGAAIVTRPNGDVSLLSAEQRGQEQGLLQIILLGPDHLIIQNDTNRALPLGTWSLMSLASFIPQTFRFPAGFMLHPGEQVQVLSDEGIAADQRSVWQWSDGASDSAPMEFQVMIAGVTPGSERLILSNRGPADVYLGNWRLVSTLGKPALLLPDRYLAAGSSLTVDGQPGPASEEHVLRWPNLPAVEQAYQAEQERQEQLRTEAAQRIKDEYAPLASTLGIDQLDYYFYVAQQEGDMLKGELPPFQDNPAAGTALAFAKMRFLEPQLAVGDRMPIYFVSPDGQEAYLAIHKADGSFVAYRLQYAEDMGFSTWLAEQVLPE
jgi:hypothetical protein